MHRLLVPCLVLALVPNLASGEAAGVDSRQEFPPLGCGSGADLDGNGFPDGEDAGCHFTNANPELLVTIEGPNQIDVGEQGFGLFTASIPQGAFGLQGAGINAALDAPNDPGCQIEGFGPSGKIGLQNDEGVGADPVVSHFYEGDPPPSTLVGVWSYQFLVLNCQAPGAVLLRVAMNAFDGNGAEDNEIWNANTLDLTVPEPGAAALGSIALAALALRRRR